MKNALVLAAAVFTLALSVESRSADVVIETTAGDIILPSKPPSTLAVTPCRNCPPMLLFTTRQSVYAINDQPVDLEELRRRLSQRHDAYVGLTYDTKTRELRGLHALIY